MAEACGIRTAAEAMRQVQPLIERWRVPMDILRAWKIVHEAVRARTVEETAFRELSMTVRRRWFRGAAGGNRTSGA